MKKDDISFIAPAPVLNRPLSLLNPLDYLRLLFWAFFFPQAIRWYTEAFFKEKNKGMEKFEKLQEYNRTDPVSRKLIIQAYLTVIITATGILIILKTFGFPIKWSYIALKIAVLLLVGRAAVDELPIAKGVAIGIAVGVIGGGVELGIIGNIGYFLLFILLFNIAVNIDEETIINALSSIIFISISGLVGGVVLGKKGLIIFGIIPFVFTFRFFEYIILFIYLRVTQIFNHAWRIPQFGRMVFLALPGIQKKLENQLDVNWEKGVENINFLLAYSLQYIHVVKAVNAVLQRSANDILLSRVAMLTRKLFNWNLVKHCATAFNNTTIILGSNYHPISINTPSRAVCAGFWYWYEKDYTKAEKAFWVVRELQHGTELYNISKFISNAFKTENMYSIVAFEKELDWLDSLPDPELRPETLKAIRILKTIASEARVAFYVRTPLNRSTAIKRAVADLTSLIETGETFCPEPEWPLIKDISKNWEDIFRKFGGIASEEILINPVYNPYQGYSGLPVTGHCFVGRSDIMRQIETRWAYKGLIPTLVLYGHRRIGKTSVLRNLLLNEDFNNMYVYLDMQKVGWVENTGQLLFEFAQTIQKVVSKNGMDIGPLPDPAQFSSLDTARRSFDSLLESINQFATDSQRLVLAIDEFELIELGIHDKRIDPGLLPYLRAIKQEYQWLGIIFVGLRTLDEMGRDHQSAFYGQAEYIRLGYLTREDSLKLITQPHPDFALEYEDPLIDEIYRLTFGQPYLVQRICWELVNRWNDLFLEKGKSLPRVLKLEDLKPVLTTEFYRNTGYYFEGVWLNTTENEKHLMHLLAPVENKRLSIEELKQEAKQKGFVEDEGVFEKALELLKRHDIITGDETGYGFASELMRRWVLTAERSVGVSASS